MTKDDVVKLALEAGFTWEPINNIIGPLTRLVEMSRKYEKEECIKMCDAIAADRWSLYKGRTPYTVREDGRASALVQGESIGAELCSDALQKKNVEVTE